ncbi:MAG TPA: gluconate 2-dehydrogenase subunit 3 family protein, partial [Chloroflexota bacterium]|nr:gluconate 2-dehydrogenase subunit 3 family protein [Chloroflexota bacterium]
MKGKTGEALVALSQAQAAVVAAMAARIVPSDELGPGAAEAGVIFYIDRALAGAYAEHLERYLQGIAAVDAYAHARHGRGFAGLAAHQQDVVLLDLE